MIENLK
ncbi:Protein of unknown function [Propionibacterium freudenreichii]|nr:Protein of unknown function [Propionibacterium freudenreichii subsp. freudenreichii]CEG87891.1 Protein of unknown function [Propionibacterium freudenreichii]CEG96333.1 Protein of unknown function [Propionibacterium freudenreichii]CEG98263.1 Protein of unknown function [Propionibacterium freudenreichii]CEH01461.1 Protein of unknown function [Propionibacterium freudenreichii]